MRAQGGTGRTSLAINTALGLLQAGEQSVALVDADYAAPAVDVMLNLYPERTIADLLPRLAQLDESLLQGVLATHASGLRVLMAPAPDALDAYTIGPMQIEQILGAMGRLYRWILIDLGLPMDESALAWVDASDLIVLSVLPEMAGLRNMRLLIDALLARGWTRSASGWWSTAAPSPAGSASRILRNGCTPMCATRSPTTSRWPRRR